MDLAKCNLINYIFLCFTSFKEYVKFYLEFFKLSNSLIFIFTSVVGGQTIFGNKISKIPSLKNSGKRLKNLLLKMYNRVHWFLISTFDYLSSEPNIN